MVQKINLPVNLFILKYIYAYIYIYQIHLIFEIENRINKTYTVFSFVFVFY